MNKIPVYFLFAVFAAFVGAQTPSVPDLPDAFTAKATLSVPLFGTLPGVIYFDYLQLSYRTDVTAFGQTVIDIYRYDLDPPTHYQISGGSCQSEVLDGELFPMQIPPFAVFEDYENVDGQTCEHWSVNWFDAIQLDYFAANSTDNTGKVTWSTVKFVVDLPSLGPVEWNFQNTVPGPQDPALFDVSAMGCPSPVPPPTFNIQGYVKNAINLQVVSGASVTINYNGGAQNATTNSQGLYTFQGVTEGAATITASANNFFPATSSLNVVSDVPAGTVADFSLSPKLNPGQFRSILTWAASPRDLDSHTKTAFGCEVYYRQKACSSQGTSVTLDVDATQGYGPETTTFNQLVSGTYLFYVYIFAGDGGYPVSNGRVQLFSGNGLAADVHVPTSGYPAGSRYWRVFSLDGASGNVTVINQVSPSLEDY